MTKSNSNITVLLVEDDQMIVDMYKMRFDKEGYRVLTTDKGSETLDWAKAEKPDIILLDIILPEVDGFTILHELKKNKSTSHIPVLLLTNLGQESDREKGKQMGAVDYYVKVEHDPADVVAKIKSLLKKK